MRVLLVPNVANPAAVSAAVELVTWLAGQGLEPVFSAEDAARAGLPRLGLAPTDIGEPALTIALGGDGTILKAVHLIGETEVPILGLNFGQLGFMSGAGAGQMRESVLAALSGEVRVERRATLSAEVVMDGRAVGTYRALNEIVISKGESARLVAFDLAIDGHTVMRTRADGLIVATATGSTAYALSAGGPMVAPGFGGMVVVPVAAHTLKARTILTNPADVVEIALPDPNRADACVVVDGDPTPNRRAIERVTVTRGQHDVLLVKLDGRDFYETISAEFF
ncbi:MAG: NAD(+)/NADH kinase [Coriobacteriia bacterium]|nr:NAD(+)/NADH kinase [Coriobacteriia bacterium]